MKKEKTVIGRIVRYQVNPKTDPTYATLVDLGVPTVMFLPAMIVYVGPEDTVNLQVFCDSPGGTFHQTCVYRGDEPGQWQWPKQSKPELAKPSAPDS